MARIGIAPLSRPLVAKTVIDAICVHGEDRATSSTFTGRSGGYWAADAMLRIVGDQVGEGLSSSHNGVFWRFQATRVSFMSSLPCISGDDRAL